MEERMNWKERLASLLWKVKIGERAEGLRQTRKRFDNVDSLTRETRSYLMGREVTSLQQGEDEMRIGDDNSTHYYRAPEKRRSGFGGLLAGAALLASGAGVGAALPLIFDAMRLEKSPAVVKEIRVESLEDTDRYLEIGLPSIESRGKKEEGTR